MRRRRGRRRPESGGAGARAADRGALQARARGLFGLTPGQVRRAAATLIQGTKVGEFYEDRRSSTSSSGATPEVRTRPRSPCAALQIDTPAGAGRAAASVADVASRRAERDHARERLAPHRRDLQRPGPRPGRGGARYPGAARGGPVRPRLPPGVPRRVRRAAGVAPTGCCWPALVARRHLAAAATSTSASARLGDARVPHAAVRAGRRRSPRRS